jgi:hypothetical protein
MKTLHAHAVWICSNIQKKLIQGDEKKMPPPGGMCVFIENTIEKAPIRTSGRFFPHSLEP